MSWTFSGQYYCDLCGELLPGSRSPCLCNNCMSKGNARQQRLRDEALKEKVRRLEARVQELEEAPDGD